MYELEPLESLMDKKPAIDPNDVKMMDFKNDCQEIFELKKQMDEYERLKKEVSKELENKKKSILARMKAVGLQKIPMPEIGTVSVTEAWSVKMPKESQPKEQLFRWIAAKKGEDVLHGMLSIKSATLNSFYKDELGLAIEEGNVDFRIDGLDEPSTYSKLNLTKARK